MVLNLFILPFRPRKSAALYKSVWLEEGSPLLVYSKRFLSKIKNLHENSESIEFELAMRYGNPSIEKALLSLKEKNCRKILLLPLEYINSLANTIKTHEFYGKQDKVVFSYHGIPKKYFDEGDPYHCFCQKTSRLVAEALGLEENQYITSFQSRLAAAGREWLKPYTSELMEKLPEEGVKKILILSPGFSMDCLETIEEIDEENKEIFLDSGGEAFHYIACLNDNDEHVEAINNLIANKISQL